MQGFTRYSTALLSNDFRMPSVWSFLQAPTSVFFQDVKDPSGSVANVLKGSIMRLGPCTEVRKALEFDSSNEAEEQVWELVRSMEADCAVFETMSGIRPLKCYMDMLRKLLDCDGLMMLLPRSKLLSLRNLIRRADKDAITLLVRKAREVDTRHVDWLSARVEADRPPFVAIRDHRDAYFDFIGVSVLNHSDPDPIDVLGQAQKAEEIMLTARFKDPASTPRDNKQDGRVRLVETSLYNDMYNRVS
jgi:hypothetical protein